MTPLEVDDPDATACSHLGLVDDRRSHFMYPHPAHRCFAAMRPQDTDLRRQVAFCLSATFVMCDRYVAGEGAMASTGQPRSGLASETSSIGDGVRTQVYVFRTGDSLARIAATYGLTVEQIVAMNQLDPRVPVKDGARLVIQIDRPPGGL